MVIPFRIRQIKTQQFAMFPEILTEINEVTIESQFGFGINKNATDVRCTTKISYRQDEKLLLFTEVLCFFSVMEDGSKQILTQGKIDVGFLRYLATIATGTVRGIIHTKTEDTALNPVVLPPINLVEVIKEDFIFSPPKK